MLIKKDRVSVLKFTARGKERSIKIQEQDSSMLLEAMPKIEVSLVGANLENKIIQYADRLMSVSCDRNDPGVLTLLVRNGLYVEFNDLKPIGVYGRTSAGVFLKLIGKTARPSNMDNVKHYTMFDFSAADAKTVKFWAFAGTEEEKAELFMEKTAGAYGRMIIDRHNFQKTNKAIVRLSSMNSPMKLAYDSVCLGYFRRPFVSRYHNGLDGVVFFNAEMLDFGLENAVGKGIQVRTRPAISKVFAIGLSDKLFKALAKRLIDMGSFYLPEGKTIDDLEIIMDTNGLKVESMDFNEATMTYSTDRAIELMTLDVPKESSIRTSIQMLEKLVMQNPAEGPEFILDMMRKGIADDIAERFEKEPSLLKLGESASLSNRSAVTNLILSIKPDAKDKDKGLFYTVMDQSLDSVVKSVDKLAVTIEESVYARAMSDISFMLSGVQLINFGEFYSNIDTEEAVFFKYPTMGVKEYYKARNMKVVLEERLNLIEDVELREAMREFFLLLDNAIVIMPNSEKLRNLLAGFDFDFDGIAMVWDKDFLRMFPDTKPMVVSIEITDAKEEERSASERISGLPYKELRREKEEFTLLTSEIYKEIFLKLVLAEGKTIGQISHLNSSEVELMLSILHFYKKGDKKRVQTLMGVAKRLIMEAAGLHTPGEGVYETMPVSEVREDGVELDVVTASGTFAEEMIRRISLANLNSVRNILLILLDVNVLRRRQQEMTIDFTKTGIVAKVDLWVSNFKSKTLIGVGFKIDSDSADVAFFRESVSKKVRVFDGVFSDIQSTLINEIKDYMKAQVSPMYREAGFSNSEFESFSETMETHPREFSALFTAKSLYGKFNHVLMSDIYSTTDEEIKSDLSGKLSNLWDILGGIVRSSVSSLDADKASELLMAANCYSSATRTFGSSRQRFAMKVAPELYSHYMLKDENGNFPIEAERFYGNIADRENGVVVDLTEGKVNDRFAYGETQTPFTGTVTIREINGSLFAMRNIEIERPAIDRVPVVMTSMTSKVEENDLVIFVKEKGQYEDYLAYRIDVEDGMIQDSTLVGRYNKTSMVETSDLSKGQVKAYRVSGSYHEEHTASNGKDNFVFDCIFVC